MIFKKKKDSKKEVVVVAGYLGQVGSAIYNILKESKKFEVYGFDTHDKNEFTPLSADFLHICIPFRTQDKFIKEVRQLEKKFRPKRIIIHSSVIPGTTQKIFNSLNRLFLGPTPKDDKKNPTLKTPVCYSPIRGQHDSLKQDILAYEKYFSPLPYTASETFCNHFAKMGLKVVGYNKPPAELELVKLLDVCQYGILIGWAQEAERILKSFGFKYDSVLRDFQAEHQNYYPDKRADIFPGVAGGNCVVEDAILVLEVFKSNMLKEFLISNKIKKKEI